jgi:hypothetical protein
VSVYNELAESGPEAAVCSLGNSDRQLLGELKTTRSRSSIQVEAQWLEFLSNWRNRSIYHIGGSRNGFSSSLRFSVSANVADPPGFSAGGCLRVVAREVRKVTTSAALGDTGFEGDGALMHVK